MKALFYTLVFSYSFSAFAGGNKRMALIKVGVVQNVAVWDGSSIWNTAGFTAIDVTNQPNVGPGWTYDGRDFSAPPTAELAEDIDKQQEIKLEDIENRLKALEETPNKE